MGYWGSVSGTLLAEMRNKVSVGVEGTGKYAGLPTLKMYSVPEAEVLLRTTLNKYEALLHDEFFITHAADASDADLSEAWKNMLRTDVEYMDRYKFNSVGSYMDEHWGVAIQELGHLHCRLGELSPCCTESKESDTQTFFTKDDGTPDYELQASLKIAVQEDTNVWEKAEDLPPVGERRSAFARIDVPSLPLFLVAFDIVSRHHKADQVKTLMDRMLKELKQMGFVVEIQHLVYDGFSETLKTPVLVSDKYKQIRLKSSI